MAGEIKGRGRGGGRGGGYEADVEEKNPLTLSYYNPVWLPYLNANSVLEYFTDKLNPFYDHTSNNEIIKMRGLVFKNSEELYQQLRKMKGIEYIHVHTFEPILHVVRKQKRLSSTTEVPLANYYIIAGVIYQAPDLMSVIQSRMIMSTHYLQAAFDEVFSLARFHPSTDYFWDFNEDGSGTLPSGPIKEEKKDSEEGKSSKEKKEMTNSESHDITQQMYRIDVLIRELVKKFPPPAIKPPEGLREGEKSEEGAKTPGEATLKDSTTNSNTNIITEPEDEGPEAGGKSMPPPPKKARLG